MALFFGNLLKEGITPGDDVAPLVEETLYASCAAVVPCPLHIQSVQFHAPSLQLLNLLLLMLLLLHGRGHTAVTAFICVLEEDKLDNKNTGTEGADAAI
eukprot:7468221-Ditylum_brightwellii.AAC.1